ncbi:uncharacterized protein LOC119160923 isoform X2 [Rhipicephalus microplus]|uniref:uncharacterized protein LOC119160923 isoform X2 n=1 Tax=Rhipicephalus microplus TaxID=6941 RepID=UPI003F6C89B2
MEALCRQAVDETADSTSPRTPKACEKSDLPTPQSPPTQPNDEGVLPRKPGQTSSHRDSSGTLPQASHSSFVDSTSLERVNAATTVSLYRGNVRAILEHMCGAVLGLGLVTDECLHAIIRRIFRCIITQLAESLAEAGSVGRERLPLAEASQSPPNVVANLQSTRVTIASIRTDEGHCSTTAEQAGLSSSRATHSPFDATKDDEIGSVMRVGCLLEALSDRLAGQLEQEVGPSEIIASSPAGATVETLVRFTALHPRSTRHRGAAPIQVNTLEDTDMMLLENCGVSFTIDEPDAIAPPSGAPEHSIHVAAWEALMGAALTVHHCLYSLALHIFAHDSFHGYFYEEFGFIDGIAMITVQVPVMEDPCNEFMLPCLQYLLRMNNSEYLPSNERFTTMLAHAALPEFNDSRFIRILEAAMDMPFLQEIEIFFGHSGAAMPLVHKEWSLQLIRHAPSQLRRLTYEVDRSLAECLECDCDNSSTVQKSVVINKGVPLPMLLAHRELTGCATNQARYQITVTPQTSQHNTYISVQATVRMPPNN